MKEKVFDITKTVLLDIINDISHMLMLNWVLIRSHKNNRVMIAREFLKRELNNANFMNNVNTEDEI